MPGGDGTGPAGMGPMTGRAAGYCAGYSVPGYMNPIPGGGGFGYGYGRGGWGRGRGRGGGRGRGFGRGRGWGWSGAYPNPNPNAYGAPYNAPAYGYPYMPEPTAKEEMNMLKDQAQMLKKQLEDIQDRISTLGKGKGQEGTKK